MMLKLRFLTHLEFSSFANYYTVQGVLLYLRYILFALTLMLSSSIFFFRLFASQTTLQASQQMSGRKLLKKREHDPFLFTQLRNGHIHLFP